MRHKLAEVSLQHLAGQLSVPTILLWAGTFTVVVGVGLHLPMATMMFMDGKPMAGMKVDMPMALGMVLITAGTALAGYGLIRTSPHRAQASLAEEMTPAAREPDGALRPAHWRLMLTLVFALIIDVMKPATLGFVVPGVAAEYGLTRSAVALLPFAALTGTMVGSFLWGFIADAAGRRAAILLAALMFIGTSICGAMPSFGWNLAMCFLMGASAGGLLPIAYTLLAESIPAQHRGWCLVLLGGLGLVGGYFAASMAAALLEPHFGWRILWLLGLPTGLMLMLLNRFIPESPRFGVVRNAVVPGSVTTPLPSSSKHLTLALNLAALAWGLINFGLLLWLPADLRAQGLSVSASDRLLAGSAALVLPTIVVTAWLYHRWSTKGTLVLLSLVTALGLLGLAALGTGLAWGSGSPVPAIVLLMVGSSGVIAVLLPYAAETCHLAVRGRAIGLVAGSSKLGGIFAQAIGMAALVPKLTSAALILIIPVLLAAAMIVRKGVETRGLELDPIDLND